jgi:hypothetical protein
LGGTQTLRWWLHVHILRRKLVRLVRLVKGEFIPRVRSTLRDGRL